MTSALAVYAGALRRAVRGGDSSLRLVDHAGAALRRVDPADWNADLLPGDGTVLARCAGPTLDVGCGPGRLTAEAGRRGLPALGIDISPAAVRLARARGASALPACVFGPLPAEGSWAHTLLIDGNIGIGGDPVRLLRRCADLLGEGGSVLVEVEPPGTRGWSGRAAIADGARVSEPFDWALVGTDDLAALAGRSGLRVTETWTSARPSGSEERRWFACLQR